MKKSLCFLLTASFAFFCSNGKNQDARTAETRVMPCLPLVVEHMALTLYPVRIVRGSDRPFTAGSGSFKSYLDCTLAPSEKSYYSPTMESRFSYLTHYSSQIDNFFLSDHSNTKRILLEKNKFVGGFYFPSDSLYKKLGKKFMLLEAHEKGSSVEGCKKLEPSSLYFVDLESGALLRLTDPDANYVSGIAYSGADDAILFLVRRDSNKNCEFDEEDQNYLFGFRIAERKRFGPILTDRMHEEILSR